LEVHFNGRDRFDRLIVERSWPVTPLANVLDCSLPKVGVRAAHGASFRYRSILSDYDFDDNYADPAFGPSCRRIDQLRTGNERR
jgi:hypothetical protein